MTIQLDRFKDETNFIYLRYTWISSSPLVLAISNRFSEALKQDREPQRKSKTDYSQAFCTVLTTLEVAGAYAPDQWIRIVTDAEVFGGAGQRNPTYNRQILAVLEWLIENKFLIKVDGRRTLPKPESAGSIELPFAYVISGKWRSQISDKPLSLANEVYRNPLASYVQLRTKVKARNGRLERSKTLDITAEHRRAYPELTTGTESLLKAADELWRTVDIRLQDEVVQPLKLSMTRIFNNGTFDNGGRFYCQLQNIKKTQRQLLRFNGEPVVEIDFSSMHPNMLYHLQGKRFKGEGVDKEDAYCIDGFDRALVKVALNTMLNLNSKGRSAASVLSNNLGIDNARAKALEHAIKNKHSNIADSFNTGVGLRLQRIDSDIAYQVMSTFILDCKRPILMVHDSAIVSVRDVRLLLHSMGNAYSNVIEQRLKDEKVFIDDFNLSPATFKVESTEFTELLKATMYKELECNELSTHNVSDEEWRTAINDYLGSSVLLLSAN